MDSVLVANALSLPPFEWQAALWVGAIVVVGTAVVLTVAILSPFVAVQAGATLLGTAAAVAVISLCTGVVGGAAAGFVKGGINQAQQNASRRQWVAQISRVSGQLDVRFEAGPDDPKKAADFRCTLVSYDETQPNRPVLEQHVAEQSSEAFFEHVGLQFDKWLNRRTAVDAGQGPRQVKIYMEPFPGDGVYERLKELCWQRGGIGITRVEGRWTSALPERPPAQP